MRSTIELTVDNNGSTVIRIKNDERSKEIGDLLLTLFCRGAKLSGLEIVNPSGYADTEGNAHETYEIKVKI